ncbi:MAG: hypothetical protein D6713_01130 [Deltaproteobacteria bacterium]|nr:MAG: hypothetical protein D6713_01130 [Deltaproteobacteria bacterium]
MEEEVDLVEAIRARKREKKRRTLRLWAVSLVVIVLVGLGTLAVKKLTEIPVVVTPVEGFQVKDVRIERKEGKRYLVGTLVDEAVDAPLFSLTSIGVRVMVETGERVFVDTIYPLGPIGEPGALKKGEEGEFSVLLPEGKILRVILTPRVVDLGKEKKFYRPRRRRRR